jgi:hypothetical protein
MSNLLKDLLPDAPRETSVLVAAAEAGLAQVLLDHVGQGMDVATASSLSASAFAARTPFTPEACSWVVGELSVALSLAPAEAPQAPPEQAAQGAGEAARQGLPPAAQATPGGKAETLPAQDATAGTSWAVGTGAGVSTGAGGGAGSGTGYPPPPPGTGFGSHPGAGGAPGAEASGAGYGSDPGAPAGAEPVTGPGKEGMPKQRRIPKKWMILTGAVAVVAVIGVIVALTHNNPSPAAPIEPVSKIISQLASGCERASHFGMRGVTSSQFCKAKANPSDIGIYAFQFDSTRDYQAGLSSLNRGYGFNPTSADGQCPPAAGSSTGAVPWFSKVDRTYRERPGQTLECYTYVRFHVPEYLWTLPTKRVILIADDHKSGATLTDLDNWWTTLSYR